MVDCFRDRLWPKKNIVRAYSQNMFLFVEQATLLTSPILMAEKVRPKEFPLYVVHPDIWLAHLNAQPTLRPLLKALPQAVALAFRTRVQRFFSRRTKKQSPPTSGK